MHELSIALSIIDLAGEEAERRRAKVLAVHLKLGELSGVVKEALLSAFELAREGSALADAQLLIEEVAVVIFCPACQAERQVRSARQLCCPDCGTLSPNVVNGRELEISALEICDDTDDAAGRGPTESAQAE